MQMPSCKCLKTKFTKDPEDMICKRIRISIRVLKDIHVLLTR